MDNQQYEIKCKEYKELAQKYIMECRKTKKTFEWFHPTISELKIVSTVRVNGYQVDHIFEIYNNRFRSIVEVQKYLSNEFSADASQQSHKEGRKLQKHQLKIRQYIHKQALINIDIQEKTRNVCFREEHINCGIIMNKIGTQKKVMIIFKYRKFKKIEFENKHKIIQELQNETIYYDVLQSTIYVRFKKENNKSYKKLLEIMNFHKIYEIVLISDEYIPKTKKEGEYFKYKKLFFGRVVKNIICIPNSEICYLPDFFKIS